MLRGRFSFAVVLAVLMVCGASVLRGEVVLPKMLSDHAVLQRDRPVRVWGWANPGEVVRVRFHAQQQQGTTDKLGNWEVWLKPEAAGGPYELTVTSDATKTPVKRRDILMGDVWIASGQSNMEFPMSGWPNQPLKNGEAEIAGAKQPKIRLLKQEKVTSIYPLDDMAATWTECTPETVKDFSAIAYFFGREIVEREHVAVGLIQTAWGGTPAHSWISPAGIAAQNLDSVYRDAGNIAVDVARAHAREKLYARQDEEAKREGKPLAKHPSIPTEALGPFTPGSLFNAMIAPDVRYAIKGVIWYQGETDRDAERSPYYGRVFPALIQDWRAQWKQEDLPFLFVQISSYPSKTGDWGAVREGQRETLSLRDTGMAVSLDVGSEKSIHPPDKQAVASRLVLAARKVAYGEDVSWQGPSFVQATAEGGAMRVWLSHAEGLMSHDAVIGDFEVAGADGVFHPAEAKIEGATILVSAHDVPSPSYVRYGWAKYVKSYLYNKEGLPLGTFSSR